jgi:hypothetical protein
MSMPTSDDGVEPLRTDRDDGPNRRRNRYRLRSGLLAAVVAGVWLGLLVDPGFGPIVRGVLLAAGLTLGILLTALGLSWLGFGLFAAGDRVVGWVKRASRWPED